VAREPRLQEPSLTVSRPTHVRSTDVRHLPVTEEDATYQDYKNVVQKVKLLLSEILCFWGGGATTAHSELGVQCRPTTFSSMYISSHDKLQNEQNFVVPCFRSPMNESIPPI
jgi:hypothetical protein